MPYYEITLGRFTDTEAETPLEAARTIATICAEDAFSLVYEVEDADTGERTSVDLEDESSYPMPRKLPEDKSFEAIELLTKIVDIKNIPGEECTDGECLDKIFSLGIEEFLKNVEKWIYK